MTTANGNAFPLTLALDAMGGDHGPAVVVEGADHARAAGLDARFVFFGDTSVLTPLLAQRPGLSSASIAQCSGSVAMTDKPAHVLRRGQDTSMWAAIAAVADGGAHAVVSCGNTGALMALAWKRLGMIEGVARPAISALWPNPRGRSVVLDVGANVEADEFELAAFAVMGSAFYRVLTGVEKPTVGLLNVGAEDQKGHERLRQAARLLRAFSGDMQFEGFIEGDDISKGKVDVVVTDGFTGNVALKTAEGAARLVGSWVKDALTASIVTKIGALLLRPQLIRLRERMDPSSVNGGVFLGVNGVVVKSHGSADAAGVKSAIEMAASLAKTSFIDDIRREAQTLAAILSASRTEEVKAAAL